MKREGIWRQWLLRAYGVQHVVGEVSRITALQEQVVPFTTQTRLTFDVLLPLWGHRGPRPTPAVHVRNSRLSATERQPA